MKRFVYILALLLAMSTPFADHEQAVRTLLTVIAILLALQLWDDIPPIVWRRCKHEWQYSGSAAAGHHIAICLVCGAKEMT